MTPTAMSSGEVSEVSYIARVSRGGAPSRYESRDAAQAALVAAARRCYAEKGVEGTRMEDVARAAGMARQTLYDFVSGREELIELSLIAWCHDMGETLESRQPPRPLPPAEDLVDILVTAIELARADPEFAYLVATASRSRVSHLLSGESVVRGFIIESLHPAIERMAEHGLLRDDVSEDAIVGWLAGLLELMATREQPAGQALRTDLLNFAVPAVLKPGAATG